MTAALRFFRRIYGRGPWHLLGHLVLIAITAWVLSIIFEAKYAPRPWNLALWLLGGAVLHDGVFLPAWGLVNAAVARLLGASDRRRVVELATGRPAEALPGPPSEAQALATPAPLRALAAGRALPPSRDAQRRVPVINHVRVPALISAVLFLVFLPRILDRQPQNFVNALGHAPPDFLMRWIWVTVGLVVASAALYAVRWIGAQRFGEAGSTSTSR